MHFSLNRWHFVAAAVAASAGFAAPLLAAKPKTVSGSPISVVKAAYQEEAADEAPSVMVPSQRPAARPAPAARPERAAPAPAPAPAPRASHVPDEVIYEDHGPYHGGHGHDPGFSTMDFNESCLSGSCSPCSAGPIWLRADYILWWRSGLDLPSVVTTSPDGTPFATAGELGRPTTSTLFGGKEEEYPVRPGGRVEAGLWLDSCETFAIGGRFFWLGDAELSYTAASNGSPILAMPFTEGEDNTLDARLISYPNTFFGNLDVRASSEVFGGDAYARMLWCRTDWGRIDLLGGYQFARLNEGLVMDSTVSDFNGASNRLIDTFDTRNEFHGGQIGVTARIDHCCYYIDLLAKVGLGNMSQEVQISGQSISTVGSTVSTLNNSGLYAQSTNVGTYTREEFVAIPEFGANFGWHITECIDVNVGYTLIVFSNVVRPGEAIDQVVNTSQIGGPLTGPARPSFEFEDTSMVLHGLNLGVTVKF